MYMKDVHGVRPHDARSMEEIVLNYLTTYAADPYHCLEKGRAVPLFKGDPTRPLLMKRHYYGPGPTWPENQSYYAMGNQETGFKTVYKPATVAVPAYGSAPDKPYFGFNCIDAAHAQQHHGAYGSFLFRTPEFAMLMHKLADQGRLYLQNSVISRAVDALGIRDNAWAFHNAALQFATGSARSSRLYSREEMVEFVAKDFEKFHVAHFEGTYGFHNPPPFVSTKNEKTYLCVNRFGAGMVTTGGSWQQHDFFSNYWIHALGVGEMFGFNNALRGYSTKAQVVLDWLIDAHWKRIKGRLLDAPRLAVDGYNCWIIMNADFTAVSGDAEALPKTYADLIAKWGQSPDWKTETTSGTGKRDGTWWAQMMSAPSWFKYALGRSGPEYDAADLVGRTEMQARIDEAMATSNPTSYWFLTTGASDCFLLPRG